MIRCLARAVVAEAGATRACPDGVLRRWRLAALRGAFDMINPLWIVAGLGAIIIGIQTLCPWNRWRWPRTSSPWPTTSVTSPRKSHRVTREAAAVRPGDRNTRSQPRRCLDSERRR